MQVRVCVWFLLPGVGYPVCEWCVVCLCQNVSVRHVTVTDELKFVKRALS